MAQFPIRQITNKQRLMGAILLFRPEGATKFIKLGPADSTEFTPNITEVESWSNEFGDRRLIGTFTTQKDGTIAITGLQMWTEFLYQALFMADAAYFTQAAVTDQTFTIPAVAVGDVVRIPVINGTVASLTTGSSGSLETFIEDIHYIFNPATGYIEVIALPVGATGDATGTYSAPAVTDSAKLLDLQIMQNSGVRGELSVTGVIQGGPGVPVEMILPDVQLKPSGAIAAGNTSALNVGALTGRVYSTSEYGYGYVRSFASVA